MQEYKITKEFVEVVLQYLGERPFKDVYLIIGALQNLEKIEENKSD